MRVRRGGEHCIQLWETVELAGDKKVDAGGHVGQWRHSLTLNGQLSAQFCRFAFRVGAVGDSATREQRETSPRAKGLWPLVRRGGRAMESLWIRRPHSLWLQRLAVLALIMAKG